MRDWNYRWKRHAVTHVRDGFDFLGFHLILNTAQSGRMAPKVKIGQEAKRQLKQRLEDAIHRRPHQESVALRINRGSAVVRGWSEYYRIACDFRSKAGTFDHWAFWIAVKAICRKLDITTGACMKKFYRYTTIYIDKYCGGTFSGKMYERIFVSQNPICPGRETTRMRRKWKLIQSFNERRRLGRTLTSIRHSDRNGYKCRTAESRYCPDFTC
jgi:hypothetical protein